MSQQATRAAYATTPNAGFRQGAVLMQTNSINNQQLTQQQQPDQQQQGPNIGGRPNVNFHPTYM
jgi:hypothetical protein